MTYDNSNNRSLSRIIGVFFTLLLTIGFLFFAFRKVDFRNAFSIISSSSMPFILLYILLFFASHYARAVRWKYMLISLKKDISKNNLFGAVIISYGISCVIPRLGEVYRALFLGKWESIPRATVLGTIVIERIIDIIIFALAMLVSVALYGGDLYRQIPWLKTSLISVFGLMFFVIVILIILIRFQKRFEKTLISISTKLSPKLTEKLRSLFDTLIDGFSSIKKGKHLLHVLIWTLVMMFLYSINTYVGFYMINMHDSEEVNLVTAWIFMTISSVGFIIPTPSGLGSYHALAIFTLTQLFHFDYDNSAAYAILTHFIPTVCFVGSTIGILYFLNRQRAKQGLTKETFLTVLRSNPENK